ncbi:MAG: phosphatidate cytidylyltransferase [Bacillota bacterium]
MGDLGVRVLSGVIGLALLIGVLLLGGHYLGIALLALSLVALREYYNAIEKMQIKTFSILGYIGAILIYFSYYLEALSINFIFSFSVIASMAATVLIDKRSIKDAALTVMGILYIPYLLFHIFYLEGSQYLWIVFIIAFGSDTFAYLIGSKFGKRKLCPEISPKKSVEGAFGGIAGSILATLIFSIIMDMGPLWSLGILALVGSIISQIGDLAASRIKRMAGIKDYGKIMPGHGGMLDRFDSIIFTAPVVYYYAYYFLI